MENYAGAVLDLNCGIGLSDKHKEMGYFYNRMDEFFANSGDDLLYGLRGQCKYEMDYFKDAIEDFNKAIEINPENEESINLRNQCIQKLDNISDALITSLSLKLGN